MSLDQLQRALLDLPRHGTLVKSRPYRQIWRFEFAGKAYYLKFYPRARGKLKRALRGNSAWREFSRLQLLQRAEIPSPRAVAHLSGFLLGNEKGDAVIIEAIEPAVRLDEYLNDLQLQGRRAPDHTQLSKQVRELVHKLQKANLGHGDLHLGNFLLHQGRLHLIDAYSVRANGLRKRDILLLAHATQRFATRTDLLRAWRLVAPDAPMPKKNPVDRTQWRKFLQRSLGENDYFGRLRFGNWIGVFFKRSKFPRRWAPAGRVDVSHDEWQRQWPDLWKKIERDELTVLKRSGSGDVLAGEVVLGGRNIPIIIKRHRRKLWHRYVTEIARGARPRRAWLNAWRLIVRDVPTAWPLLLMEKRAFGYVTDTLIVYERVEGQMLSALDLDLMQSNERITLFHRLGATLRRLEQTGLAQFDSKSTNWMIIPDPVRGPVPVLIDIDGVRRNPGWPLAVRRLLRSMRDHRQYTVEDSYWICRGYAPFARMEQEK